MGSVKEYFSSLGKGIGSLLKGLQVTGKEFVTPKITEFYPEDRDTYKWPKRFRAVLELIYDDEGNHKCIACGTCERICPNGTIALEIKTVDTWDGKKKKKLDQYFYDLGSCTFCNLCVTNCPTQALEFSNDFEQSVFTRDKLVKKLNYLPEKPEPEPTEEEKAKLQAEKEAKIAAALKAKAERAAAAGGAAPASTGAAAPNAKIAALIENAKAAVAAATTDEERAAAQAKLDKLQAAAAKMAPAAAPAPVDKIAQAIADAKAAVEAATTDEERAAAQTKLAKLEAAAKAKAARDAAAAKQ